MDSAAVAPYQPQLFSVHGRIGRLRFLAYSGFLALALGAAGIVVSLLSTYVWQGLSILLLLLMLAFVAVSVVIARRRLNDLDASGWWSIALFIPLVNLVAGLWVTCAPGTAGPNRFGAPPAPNTRAITVFAIVYVALFLLGAIAGSVAVPAYEEMLPRAPDGEVDARF